MTLLRTALLVAPIGQSSNLLNAGPSTRRINSTVPFAWDQHMTSLKIRGDIVSTAIERALPRRMGVRLVANDFPDETMDTGIRRRRSH